MAQPIEGSEPTPGENASPPKQAVNPPKESTQKGSANPKGGAKSNDSKKKKPAKKKAQPKDPEKDKLSAREIEREYGFAYKFFKSDPELWDLLQTAIKNNWSRARFGAKFQDTKWFQQHSDVYRTNYALKYTDNAVYRERLNDMKTAIGNIAGQFGMDLTRRELQTYTERAFLFGWDDAQIVDHLAKQVTPNDSGHYSGSLAGIEQQLRGVALANGVRINPDALKHWMRQIVRGNADVRQFETYIRDIAAQTFSAYGKEIRGGMDAVDIAAPYIQSMSEILELNPADVNMYDRTIRRALSHTNDKGEAAPMSITAFEDSLRADKRWQYTDNARQQMKQYAIELGKMWGIL